MSEVSIALYGLLLSLAVLSRFALIFFGHCRLRTMAARIAVIFTFCFDYCRRFWTTLLVISF
jgi:hypothetical protein